MGEVVPIRTRSRRSTQPGGDHPAHDRVLACPDCGGKWFNAIVTFRSLPGGFWKPDAYALTDAQDQPAVSCTGCGKHFLLQ